MAIDKIQSSGIGENVELSGTEAAKMPIGTTGERANAAAGDIRFNSTVSLMEYYDGSLWKAIDSPPTVASISPTTESDASANIVVTGSNFQTGATVTFIGNDGTVYASPSATRNSSTQITATTPSSALSVANEPYDIKVTNTSGLSGTLADALDAGGVPAFDTAAGSLGSLYNINRVVSGTTFDASATDPDGDTITYSVTTGTLPSGLSISSSTGMITGTAAAVGSDTTTTFTVSAATSSDTSTRQFSITVAAPVVTSYTSTGSGNFTAPTGLATVNVLVVAAGGGGGARGGGGAGAGGLIYRPDFPVTPGGTVSYTVGGGGAAASFTDGSEVQGQAQNGQDSVFGTLTSKGGGLGGTQSDRGGPDANGGAQPGGSGGGSHQNVYSNPSQPNPMPNNAIQPSQPGDSGTYGFGNGGGTNSNPAQTYSALSGGGGGAGTGGISGNGGGQSTSGNGGAGKSYSISGSSVTYAGGGGAGHHGPFPSAHTFSAGGSGGGGNGGPFPAPAGGSSGTPGTANRGGGGGGCTTDGNNGTHAGGAGGSGVVIVSY